MSTRTEQTPPQASILARLFRVYDQLWRRWHKVEPFDKVVSLAIEPYQGRARTLSDGTQLEPGDSLGIIHFNHDGFSADHNRVRAALQFRRDFSRSLHRLARDMETDPLLRGVKALYGETWIRPHGKKVGFIVEPLPRTWSRRIQHRYLRFLLKIQFPHLAHRHTDTRLHAYWLTRRQLKLLPERLSDDSEQNRHVATN